jgi:hypothetical protein
MMSDHYNDLEEYPEDDDDEFIEEETRYVSKEMAEDDDDRAEVETWSAGGDALSHTMSVNEWQAEQ